MTSAFITLTNHINGHPITFNVAHITHFYPYGGDPREPLTLIHIAGHSPGITVSEPAVEVTSEIRDAEGNDD